MTMISLFIFYSFFVTESFTLLAFMHLQKLFPPLFTYTMCNHSFRWVFDCTHPRACVDLPNHLNRINELTPTSQTKEVKGEGEMWGKV